KVIQTLRPMDFLLMSEVYYAGGTVNKDITSEVVINAVKAKGKNALFVEDRNKLIETFHQMTERDDVILFMGARDPSLADFAKDVFEKLK
ncbi:MAG TPA: hypothetical protein VNW99_07710, partial [Cytophagaceae bacterium]|nr:hypothetical protein [Cytophagaceae bacterium]